METQAHMTARRAAELLGDVLKWRLQIRHPEPAPKSVPTDRERIGGSGQEGLPFGLDQVIDTTWGDGPQGTTTSAGVDKWLRFWLPWLEYWAGTPATNRMQPGAWWLNQLQENQRLASIDEWDADDQAAWDEHCSELRTMWWQIGHLTGHAPLTRGLCPKCKTGWLRSQYAAHKPDGSGGLQDQAQCTNPNCNTEIDYSREEITAQQRGLLRDPNIDGGYYLTISEIKTIWPRLRASTVRSWARRGHVCKQGDRYSLRDINQRKWRGTTQADAPQKASRAIVQRVAVSSVPKDGT